MDAIENAIRLSVIVPFYNAERYISQCVDSLMRQTLQKGIEYIFINDGSTDGSIERLSAATGSYPQRKGQITILENDGNKGTAYSRQRGIDAARGEFIIHCDADDWIEPEMYGTLLNIADSAGADVVCTPYFLEKGGKTQTVSFPTLDFPLLNDMPLDTLHGSLWTKIIRKSVLSDNGIRIFEGVDCWEDASLMFRVPIFTRRIVVYNKPFYHYRKETRDSLTTEKMSRVLADHLLFAESMDKWFAAQPPELSERYGQFILYARFMAKIKLMRGGNRDIRRWKTTYPETNRRIMDYKNIPLFYRLCFLLADRLPEWLVRAASAAVKIF